MRIARLGRAEAVVVEAAEAEVEVEVEVAAEEAAEGELEVRRQLRRGPPPHSPGLAPSSCDLTSGSV